MGIGGMAYYKRCIALRLMCPTLADHPIHKLALRASWKDPGSAAHHFVLRSTCPGLDPGAGTTRGINTHPLPSSPRARCSMQCCAADPGSDRRVHERGVGLCPMPGFADQVGA